MGTSTYALDKKGTIISIGIIGLMFFVFTCRYAGYRDRHRNQLCGLDGAIVGRGKSTPLIHLDSHDHWVFIRDYPHTTVYQPKKDAANLCPVGTMPLRPSLRGPRTGCLVQYAPGRVVVVSGVHRFAKCFDMGGNMAAGHCGTG